MDLSLTFYRGSVIVSPGSRDGSGIFLEDAGVSSLAKEIARHLRALVVPTTVTRPKGTRGFNFHWSNAQAEWDAKTWNEPSWHTDGAEFLVYFTKDALSPLGRPWTLKEMEYIAKALPSHPGYAFSMEMSRRVAARFLDRRA